MKERSSKIYIYFSILMVLTIFASEYNPFIQAANNVHVFKAKDDALYQQITKSAKKYNETSQDAYIDRVWKKTPGRNGRKVNVDGSYEKMSKEGEFDTSLLVFDETAPSVSIKDLPPSPIYRGHPEKQMVALMINVSWGKEYIPSILQTVNKSNVKATFFVEGKWAAENKNIVKMIHEQDHLIGNHAYNHPDMKKMSQEDMKEQIEKTNDILEAIVGYRPGWFAPPSGNFNDQVVATADNLNMETILWTVDTIDWKNPPVSVMLNRVKDNIHPGATVLMHPTEVVAEGLESLVNDIKEKDYEIGTVETLISEKR